MTRTDACSMNTYDIIYYRPSLIQLNQVLSKITKTEL